MALPPLSASGWRHSCAREAPHHITPSLRHAVTLAPRPRPLVTPLPPHAGPRLSSLTRACYAAGRGWRVRPVSAMRCRPVCLIALSCALQGRVPTSTDRLGVASRRRRELPHQVGKNRRVNSDRSWSIVFFTRLHCFVTVVRTSVSGCTSEFGLQGFSLGRSSAGFGVGVAPASRSGLGSVPWPPRFGGGGSHPASFP